ncbi:uncharacterized protein F4807DRAFT_30223 [Annulohypoxylon truncatum]|uniref:uncharacterized protein n=1 Tax=Annulohypoxylon truncatum TaxID=327061 RepID=UPI002008D4C5|nr:uncharacterized protein F4807DRAFT_30223 [Annulohypoxylon truncatum]KAI1211261.1 hypothetical protein F4807DRAFT_30223 [Annulohypoxylon truncatum]
MANNPYEVEHNIKAPAHPPHKRRPDMSSFTSQLHQISRDSPASNAHSHVGPTPVDVAGLYHLVHDQFATLFQDAPTSENRTFLNGLMTELQSDIQAPPDQIPGVRQEYLDSLDRVPKKQLKQDDSCPICAENYLDDPYPLVVELPCHGSHRFDLECVGPWLQSKGSCPMCRKDLTKKKVIEIPKDEEEEEDDVDGLYG